MNTTLNFANKLAKLVNHLPELRGGSVKVYAVLLMESETFNRTRLSSKGLVDMTGVSRNSIRDALTELIDKGLIDAMHEVGGYWKFRIL